MGKRHDKLIILGGAEIYAVKKKKAWQRNELPYKGTET